MTQRSKLLRMTIRNIGCIGNEGVEIALDDIVCLVGRNNAGKSTVLKAYELAQGAEKFDVLRDRCSWAPEEEPSEIVLDVHIPEGVANIAEEWKVAEGGLLLLRSRWRWEAESGYKVIRQTWDPAQNGWAEDGKAGGADAVFQSRLPRPLRIGSLQDADKSEGVLLALALDPFIQEIQAIQADPNSELAKTVATMTSLVDALGENHQERFGDIAQKVQSAFAGVFPGVGLKLNVAMTPPPIKVADLLKAGSGLRIVDGKAETSLLQQGTGARRALFWSMLRVHNELKRLIERRDEHRKQLVTKRKKAKGADAEELDAQIAAIDAGAPIPEDAEDPALPGYLLLVDEPENALHPMAARAAQRHLYELAKDPDWQVVMTTHSPYFINPLEDHTTIVRMERTKGDESALFTKVYRSEEVTFDEDERRNLQALQQMDVSFSEVFFGSYPILVEGDTEHAAFIAAVTEEQHVLADKVTIVRARGKAILPALIRMLHHFKISFGLLHDTDWPYNKAGNSGMWTMNATIHAAISDCRQDGLAIRHRYSLPDFERALGGDQLGKDKPFAAYERVVKEVQPKQQVQALVQNLFDGTDHGPACSGPHNGDVYLASLLAALTKWAGENGAAADPRLVGYPKA